MDEQILGAAQKEERRARDPAFNFEVGLFRREPQPTRIGNHISWQARICNTIKCEM
jgi:hypothetical protein